MKATAEDFKDQLAGSIDKVDAVKDIRRKIENYGLSVRTTRRKLATGRKIYFHITNPFEDLNAVQGLRHQSRTIVQIYFPNAGITSACSSEWTISEY